MPETSNGLPWHSVPYEEALESLLREFYESHDLWMRLFDIGVSVDFPCDPLGRLLDFAGVPADNTVETNACEIANETGEWPRNAICRDSFYDEALDRRDDPKQFIRDVLKQVDEWVADGRLAKPVKA